MSKKMIPFFNVGPGDLIKDELEFYNWSQKDLSEILSLSEKHISKILNNEVPVTFEIAKLLSKTFKQSPQYWLNAYNNYKLRLESENSREKAAEIRAEIYRYMPIREMRKKGWITKSKEINELKKAVIDFWEMSSLDFSSFKKQIKFVNLRKSEAFKNFNPNFAFTWLQMARKNSSDYSVAPFNKSQLKELAKKIIYFTKIENGIKSFLEELNNCGVKFFILSHLPQTYTDGASFWYENNPVIVYTIRYDRVDNFWFTIAHEIGHVLLHLKISSDKFFIDSSDDFKDDSLEKEADDFARKILNCYQILDYFKGYSRIPQQRIINSFDNFNNIHPSIIVGFLQYKGLLSHRSLNHFKEKVKEQIPEKYFIEKFLS